MIENYNHFLLVCGFAFLLGGFAPYFLKRLPLSLPMLQVILGLTIGYLWTSFPFLSPIDNGTFVEKLCELVVLVSLVGAGIKLDTPLKYQRWRPTIRLLLITMPLCIVAMAALGHYIFSLSLGAALLLGAVLAPTDPVLASSVQVGPPNGEGEDLPRFSLTSEAGLNDGLAFPFVYLAIKIAEQFTTTDKITSNLLLDWFTMDVVWRIAAGLVIGVAVGKIIGRIVFSNRTKETALSQGYVIIAITLLAYGLAEFIHGYGFIAVFVAAFAFRRTQHRHDYHEELHDFAEQSEGLLMSLVLVIFGMALGQGLSSGVELTWQVYAVSLIILLLVRPLAGWIGLAGLNLPHKERFTIASLGIRGTGQSHYKTLPNRTCSR
ncbi:K(+)/H(+) antiporter NhaP2 [Psychrobacter pasteurii]|uniref:K(+)/H(+) antiporter NhaP2 n=1 Tax=Psychrobacter pasteurii TaxID=1945520 RepID=A0A1R4EI08_9GAMM|nr:cation:proton antiporter [Psychrobacter pasteurii]SJM38090.1 K(+)/H(+) antiporter NhaP2 [Psychrobacter pasteurii]